MSNKLKSKDENKDTEEDLADFKELPEESKEMMALKEESEKTTGSEQVETTREIEGKSRKLKPNITKYRLSRTISKTKENCTSPKAN